MISYFVITSVPSVVKFHDRAVNILLPGRFRDDRYAPYGKPDQYDRNGYDPYDRRMPPPPHDPYDPYRRMAPPDPYDRSVHTQIIFINGRQGDRV